MPGRAIKVGASEVTFELHTLGWKAFQHLCATIVGDIWGQTIQTFYEARDGGRDGAFRGTWINDGKTFDGTFTVQCKFTNSSISSLKLKDLKEEIVKAARLAEEGLADNYIIFSNAKLTGSNDERIRKEFEDLPGIKSCAIYGFERINQIIRESSRLRMLVPRIYGLGDLSQILDERASSQAAEILSSLGSDLNKFVITDAYQKSARALVEHGFVLLLGEPACGKSTIAAALALGAIDQWNTSTIKVRNADEFVRHSNPLERNQFFWVDDAFGATQLDEQAVTAWNGALPHVQAAIHRGAKVIFTSRSYIYQAAVKLLKQTALPIVKESQVVIRVEELSAAERDQILYNHIRLGSQSIKFKSSVKPYLPIVSSNEKFSPEIARRLGAKEFTKSIVISERGLTDFVERPMDLLIEVIQTLDANSRAAMGLVFMNGGALSSPLSMNEEEKAAVLMMGGKEAGIRDAITSLDGSFVIRVLADGSYSWRFKHPTIRDAMALLVAADFELLDVYIAGTSLGKIFQEVSCGVPSLGGVKIIIPSNRFETLLSRIDEAIDRNKFIPGLQGFLAFRCSRDFLASFLRHQPSYVDGLYFNSYLSADIDVDVVVKLHRLGLLKESDRLHFVDQIRTLAIATPDSDFLEPHIADLLTAQEMEDLIGEVERRVLPRLAYIVDSRKDEFEGDDPSSHFEELTGALNGFSRAFKQNPRAASQIYEAIDLIDEAIDELRPVLNNDEEMSRSYERSTIIENLDQDRSIFDDVDS